MKINRYLEMAIILSRNKKTIQKRYNLAAVGVRSDGVAVFSVNGNPFEPEVKHHAEGRISRKLTPGSVVYVARTTRDSKTAIAKPCRGCQIVMRSVGVYKCIYTISDREFGVMYL
jgi:hypothetical protein